MLKVSARPKQKKIIWLNVMLQLKKEKKQHNDCFHADLDTLEREVSQYQQRYNHIIPTGWTFKSYFERPSGPLAPGLERFYARGNPNRLINGFDLL